MAKCTTQQQYETLVSFFEKNPELSKSFISKGEAREKLNKFWQQLTKDINLLGPPVRDTIGWKKVWADYKYIIKKKRRLNRIELSALEERVIYLTNIDHAAVESVENCAIFIPEIEYNSDLETSKVESETSENIIESSENGSALSENESALSEKESSTRKRKRNGNKNEMRQLLEKQTNIQKLLYKEVLGTLDEIVKSTKENNKTNQSILSVLEKTYAIKKKKLEWLERAHKEKLAIMRQKLELKKLQLDLKGKKVQIKEETHKM